MENKNRLNIIKHLPLVLLFINTSCDAIVQMTYTVENKSSGDITLFIPSYPTDSIPKVFGERKDTTLTLKPDQKIVVGIERKLDFPWETKNIYNNLPGMCGLKKIESDTTFSLDCSKSSWKYRKRNSNLKFLCIVDPAWRQEDEEIVGD